MISLCRSRFGVAAALLMLGVLLVLSMGWPSQTAEAHANQARSSPAPDSELEESPDRVIVWFSEQIEASLSEVRVLDQFARQVDNDDSALSPTESTALIATLPELENGTYTVVWRNLSTVDGHRVVGSYRFSVGEPLSEGTVVEPESQPLLQSGADPWLRWVYFVGALGMAGTLIFDLLVVRPMLRSDGTQPLSVSNLRTLQETMRSVMLVSFGLAAFGMVALLVQQAMVTFQVSVFGIFDEALGSVLGSSWGRLWTWRFIAVVATGVLVFLAGRSVLRDEDEDDVDEDDFDDDEDSDALAFTESILGVLALAASLSVLALTSFASHNAAVPVEARSLATTSDFVHLLAASAWLGGLFLLAVAIPRLSSSGDDAGELPGLLRRFSPVALVSAGTLIITGIFSGYMQVTIPAATATPHGWTLVTKLILLVPLFAIAGINSYRITRGVLRNGLFHFRKLVRAEAIIAVLVLAAVGWMAGLEPARQYAARTGIGVADSVSFSDFVEGANIDTDLAPGRVGSNSATIRLTDRRGDPITNATDVRIRVKFLEDDLGEPLISLVDNGNGVWSLDDVSINIGGVYQMEVRVVRPDAFDALTSFRFDAAPGVAAGDPIRPARTATWTLFALELLVIGLLLVVATPIFRGGLRSASKAVAFPGAAVTVVGIVLLLNAQVIKAGFPEERFNPFPLNSESIEIGRQVYLNTCATCHGESGHGDGPSAGGLSRPPADLAVHVPLHSDSVLFGYIRDGIPGTPMPPQKDNLTEVQMWHLVNFLHTFER